MISANCPQCSESFEVQDADPSEVACPTCGFLFKVAPESSDPDADREDFAAGLFDEVSDASDDATDDANGVEQLDLEFGSPDDESPVINTQEQAQLETLDLEDLVLDASGDDEDDDLELELSDGVGAVTESPDLDITVDQAGDADEIDFESPAIEMSDSGPGVDEAAPVIETLQAAEPEPAADLEPIAESDPVAAPEPVVAFEPAVEPDTETDSEPVVTSMGANEVETLEEEILDQPDSEPIEDPVAMTEPVADQDDIDWEAPTDQPLAQTEDAVADFSDAEQDVSQPMMDETGGVDEDELEGWLDDDAASVAEHEVEAPAMQVDDDELDAEEFEPVAMEDDVEFDEEELEEELEPVAMDDDVELDDLDDDGQVDLDVEYEDSPSASLIQAADAMDPEAAQAFIDDASAGSGRTKLLIGGVLGAIAIGAGSYFALPMFFGGSPDMAKSIPRASFNTSDLKPVDDAAPNVPNVPVAPNVPTGDPVASTEQTPQTEPAVPTEVPVTPDPGEAETVEVQDVTPDVESSDSAGPIPPPADLAAVNPAAPDTETVEVQKVPMADEKEQMTAADATAPSPAEPDELPAVETKGNREAPAPPTEATDQAESSQLAQLIETAEEKLSAVDKEDPTRSRGALRDFYIAMSAVAEVSVGGLTEQQTADVSKLVEAVVAQRPMWPVLGKIAPVWEKATKRSNNGFVVFGTISNRITPHQNVGFSTVSVRWLNKEKPLTILGKNNQIRGILGKPALIIGALENPDTSVSGAAVVRLGIVRPITK